MHRPEKGGEAMKRKALIGALKPLYTGGWNDETA